VKIRNLFIPAVIAHSQANIDNKVYRAFVGALVKINHEIERQGFSQAGELGGFSLPTNRLQKSEKEIENSRLEIRRERNNMAGARAVTEAVLDISFACGEMVLDLKEMVQVTIPQQLRDGSGSFMRSRSRDAEEASATLEASRSAAKAFDREIDLILRDEIRAALSEQEE
jgi:hypothetical protein